MTRGASLLGLLVLALAGDVRAQAEAPLEDYELPSELLEDELEETLDEAPEAAEPPLDVAAIAARATALRKAELSGPAYEFCTNPEFRPKSASAKRFCKLADSQMQEVCPEAARLCFEEPKKDPFRLPDWALYTLMAIALGVLGLGIAWFVISLLRQWRSRDHEELVLAPSGPSDLSLETLPEAEALSLLREAEACLLDGRTQEAALLLHLAALRHCEDAGLAPFHPATTNGEYLAMLRPHREMASLFREVTQITDRLRFGDGAVDHEVVARSIPRARALFSLPTGRSTGLLGVAAGLAAVALISACEGQDSSFFSHRPEGLSALPALLAKAGVPNKVVRRMPEVLPEDAGVVVIRTDATSFPWLMDRTQLDELLDRDLAVIILDDIRYAEALLPVTSTIALADLVAHPEPAALEITDEYFCRFDQALFKEEVLDAVEGELVTPAGVALVAGTPAGPPPFMGREAELVPLLLYPSGTSTQAKVVGYGALRRSGEGEYRPGCLAVFSTSELFSNAALSRAMNVAYAVGLITSLLEPHESVLFVDGFQDSGAGGSVGNSMQNSKVLPFVLHAGLWVAVLFVAMGAAFGRLRDPVRTEHKAFLEHAEALGLYYASSGEAGQVHAAEALARLVVSRYRHQVRGGSKDAWAALAAHLAERHELDGREVLSALSSGLEEQMRTAVREHIEPVGPARALELLSKILASDGHQENRKKGS